MNNSKESLPKDLILHKPMMEINDLPTELIVKHSAYKNLKKKYDKVCKNLRELEKSCNDMSDMIHDLCDVIEKLEVRLDEAYESGDIDEISDVADTVKEIKHDVKEQQKKRAKTLKSVEIDFDPFKKKLAIGFNIGPKDK